MLLSRLIKKMCIYFLSLLVDVGQLELAYI